MSKKCIHIIFIIALVLLTACERRTLQDKSEDITIKVDIELNTIVNVTTEIYNELITTPEINPEMMRVLFYNPDTKELVTQSFINSKGKDEHGNPIIAGNIQIMPGVYDMVCYNFDVSSILIRSEEHWNTIEAYTEQVEKGIYNGLKSRTEDYPIDYEPEHLLVSRVENVKIDPSSKVIVIESNAKTIIDTYYVQVELKNAKYVSTASAVISGMSASNKIALNQRSENPSAVYFKLQRSKDTHPQKDIGKDGATDVLCASFSTFGKIEGVSSKLFITFDDITVDGKPVQRTFDLTEVFKTEDAIKKHWLIIKDQILEVPKPDNVTDTEENGGGFNPEVNDWEDQQGDIIL